VAAQVGIERRDHHQVPGAGRDLLLTPGAEIGLGRLERVDQADLDRSVQRGISAHTRRRAITANAAATMT